LMQPFPLTRCPLLSQSLVWSSVANGLTSGPIFKLCQHNCCSIHWCGGHFARESRVVVTQAGQLEGWWQAGDCGCSAPLHGASTAFINDAGDTTSSPAKADTGREKGPCTEKPHGLDSNNALLLARSTLRACLQTQSNSASTSSCPSPTAARLKLNR
ncbi:hypothetical protein KUCAC02_008363, partial [Chaenocephalus aceratus]